MKNWKNERDKWAELIDRMNKLKWNKKSGRILWQSSPRLALIGISKVFDKKLK